MQSRKYPTFQEAITYLESKGTLIYGGWEGQTEGYYIYNFTFKGIVYRLKIFKDGKVEIRE
jgi:hypothetical protein